jgi:hypothetical protein
LQQQQPPYNNTKAMHQEYVDSIGMEDAQYTTESFVEPERTHDTPEDAIAFRSRMGWNEEFVDQYEYRERDLLAGPCVPDGRTIEWDLDYRPNYNRDDLGELDEYGYGR